MNEQDEVLVDLGDAKEETKQPKPGPEADNQVAYPDGREIG
jgi:hypothetical protein